MAAALTPAWRRSLTPRIAPMPLAVQGPSTADTAGHEHPDSAAPELAATAAPTTIAAKSRRSSRRNGALDSFRSGPPIALANIDDGASTDAAAGETEASMTPLEAPSNAAPLRRMPSRRAPLNFIFPSTYESRPVSAKTTQLPERALRNSSIYEYVSKDYLTALHSLFQMCDIDDDGVITEKELALLLQLMGIVEHEAREVATYCRHLGVPPPSSTLPDPATPSATQDQLAARREALASGSATASSPGVSFDVFLKQFRLWIIVCATQHPLPRVDFVLRCKRLKHGFKKIDGNGNWHIQKTELEIAMQKLDLVVSDDDLHRVFTALDRDGDGELDWSEFVYAAWHNTLQGVLPGAGEDFTLDLFADLPTFIRPAAMTTAVAAAATPGTPKTRLSFASIRRSFVVAPLERSSFTSATGDEHGAGSGSSESRSAIERIGIAYLKRISMKHLSEAKKTPKANASDGSSRRPSLTTGQTPRHVAPIRRRYSKRSGFSWAVRRQIRFIESMAVAIAAIIGILCGLLSIWFEDLVTHRVTDGTTAYVLYIILINVVVSLFEVHAMYFTAVVCAFRVTICTNLRLYPLDAEREFLMRAIARAALQIGHRQDRLFGIDPMKSSPRIVLWASYFMFKSKRYVLKFVLKLFIKRVLWRAAAKLALSLLVLPINGVMNAWTLRRVMRDCRVSIIGPPAATGLLETFFVQDDLLSPFQRVDYLRVLGCAVVCKRRVHPNLEIMIDHMRAQWVKPALWPAGEGCTCLEVTDDGCPLHVLDDQDRLLGSLRLYASQRSGPLAASAQPHLRNVFYLLVVALITDGDVDWIERRYYVRACHAARLQNNWRAVLQLKDRFVSGKGIHAEAVCATIVELPDADNDGEQHRVPWRESLVYVWNRVSSYLAL
ncbi:hypothetical protein ATCC90586_001840 [Pythium insidiosum]|nr:hypothetical protein ATCC90586_001840 [Pythium insidiosum]